MKKVLKSLLPASIVRLALPMLFKPIARRNGLNIDVRANCIDITKGINTIRVSRTHAVYLQDIMVLPNLHCRKFPKLPLCPAML